VGEKVRNVAGRKILILNGATDRETAGMSATDFVMAVANGLNRYGEMSAPVDELVNALLVAKGGVIPVDISELNRLGVEVYEVDSAPGPVDAHSAELTSALATTPTAASHSVIFEDRALVRCISQLTSNLDRTITTGLHKGCGSDQSFLPLLSMSMSRIS